MEDHIFETMEDNVMPLHVANSSTFMYTTDIGNLSQNKTETKLEGGELLPEKIEIIAALVQEPSVESEEYNNCMITQKFN